MHRAGSDVPPVNHEIFKISDWGVITAEEDPELGKNLEKLLRVQIDVSDDRDSVVARYDDETRLSVLQVAYQIFPHRFRTPGRHEP